MADPPPVLPSLDDTVLAAQVEAALVLAGIALEPQWRDAVRMNFKANAQAARLVLEFPLPEDCDPAPVFAP